MARGSERFYLQFPAWMDVQTQMAAWQSQSTSGAVYLSRTDLRCAFGVAGVLLLQLLPVVGNACLTSRHFHRETREIFDPLDAELGTEYRRGDARWRPLRERLEVPAVGAASASAHAAGLLREPDPDVRRQPHPLPGRTAPCWTCPTIFIARCGRIRVVLDRVLCLRTRRFLNAPTARQGGPQVLFQKSRKCPEFQSQRAILGFSAGFWDAFWDIVPGSSLLQRRATHAACRHSGQARHSPFVSCELSKSCSPDQRLAKAGHARIGQPSL